MPYPYSTTVNGLTTTLTQLRSAFPAKVNAETLKKWGIAANNESSILNTIRFLKLIDEEGNKAPGATPVFVIHDDSAFAAEFAVLVRDAYQELFELNGDGAWNLDRDRLINFFRTSDNTSHRVGEAQASTFVALATFAGYATPAATNGTGGAKPRAARRPTVEKPKTKATSPSSAPVQPMAPGAGGALQLGGSPLSVSVRIELNLPISDKQEVYDNIFKSIRENLINA